MHFYNYTYTNEKYSQNYKKLKECAKPRENPWTNRYKRHIEIIKESESNNDAHKKTFFFFTK